MVSPYKIFIIMSHDCISQVPFNSTNGPGAKFLYCLKLILHYRESKGELICEITLHPSAVLLCGVADYLC